MATLQKFKFLAIQCAVAASPTRSPITSPVIQLRRRKTLRMLLGRAGIGAGRWFPDRRRSNDERSSTEMVKELSVRNKLQDLFVLSSPPALEENVREGMLPTRRELRGGGGSRLLSATLRQRLLRRAWRPR
ncbi:hypothetical protein ACJIZ3_002296 [Penstemon smallii]|uniref:Uncharacterized protein n=1 Tax=Penstemon smallii TaxID=265156 RepID=A0ABD3U9S3_9LAMI